MKSRFSEKSHLKVTYNIDGLVEKFIGLGAVSNRTIF